MKSQSRTSRILLGYAAASVLFILSGCSNEPGSSPLSPMKSARATSTLAKGSTATTTSAVSAITPLPRRTRSANGFGGTGAKYITVSGGGTFDYMNHKMTVPPGALSQNTEMYITDISSNYIQANYGPSGEFNLPVVVTISYADADLRNVDLKKMTIAWYDETAGAWIDVGGVVDRVNQTISVPVMHFTQYTISSR